MTRLLTILWKALQLTWTALRLGWKAFWLPFNLLLRALSFPARWAKPFKIEVPLWVPPGDDPRQLWRAIEERRESGEARHHLWQTIEQRRAQLAQETAGEPEPDAESAVLPPSLRSHVERASEPVDEAGVLPPSLRMHLSEHPEGRRRLWQAIGERRALRAEQNTAKPEPVVRPVRAERSRRLGSPRPLRARVVGRRALLSAAVMAVLVLAAAAVAYVTVTGSGFALSTAGAVQQVTISPATPTSELYPGGSADVAATISNPNTSTAHLSSLALDTSLGTQGFSVDSLHSGCNLSSLSFPTQTGPFIVPPKVGAINGTSTVHLTNAISMSNAAVSACQGSTFTVYLKVGP